VNDREREQERLRYISKSIALVQQYTRGNRDVFEGELLVQDAVLRRLETLADAASKVSDALKHRHPEVPWRQVYDFRNIAAHAYEFVKLDRVWEIVVNHLPVLKNAVDQELDSPAMSD
jgi:uncharacterized protein with HEPN domain